MPGPLPRQHKHERQYTPSAHSVIPTRRIWNDDYDGQMIFGDLGGLKFPDICHTGEEKPRKNLTQETRPDKRACYHLLHSGGRQKYVSFFYSYYLEMLQHLWLYRISVCIPKGCIFLLLCNRFVCIKFLLN